MMVLIEIFFKNLQIENPSEDELPLGLEASINEDAFDLDELTEDENDDVVDPTAAALGTDASVYHSSVPEVVFYSSNFM